MDNEGESETAGNLPPGWYPNPGDPRTNRFWSGNNWTDEIRPLWRIPAVEETPKTEVTTTTTLAQRAVDVASTLESFANGAMYLAVLTVIAMIAVIWFGWPWPNNGAVIVGAIVAAAIIFTIALLVNTLLELGAVVSLYIHSHASRETEQHKQPL